MSLKLVRKLKNTRVFSWEKKRTAAFADGAVAF